MVDEKNIAAEFYWNDEALRFISQQFCHALKDSLTGKPSSLSHLGSCMSLPSGNEQGVFLALDFGGTNVRVSRVRLMGKRCYVIEKMLSYPLRSEGRYDYLSAATTKEELFDFLADCVSHIAVPGTTYLLGHTFSFATAQEGASDARFIAWSKEVKVAGMEGLLVNDLLQQALARRGLESVKPVAIVNDTTAALLAAAYQQESTQIALICGTGFNMCYYEPTQLQIVNLEAGNFDDLVGTAWDIKVDEESEIPGDHRLEKMVSGRYVGEIFCRCAADYFGVPQLTAWTAAQMNQLVSIEDEKEGKLFVGRLWQRIVTGDDFLAMKTLASSIFVRAAQLTGAACAGILSHLYPQGDIPEQFIAIEGSVMEKVTGSVPVFGNALRLCFAVDKEGWTRPVPVKVGIVQHAPSVGAAVAAAMAAKKINRK